MRDDERCWGRVRDADMLLTRLVDWYARRGTTGWLLRRGTRDIAGCREVKAMLVGYAEGSIDAVTCLRVERHVTACRRCGMLVATYASLRAAAAARSGDLHSLGIATLVEADGPLGRSASSSTHEPLRTATGAAAEAPRSAT